MLAIYKRELKSYFTSMIGPIFIAVAVAFTGVYFMVYNLSVGYQYFSYALGSTLFIYILLVPILTMRSLSEERRSKTDQLLLTSPVTVGQMVMGKYLAMLTVLAIVIGGLILWQHRGNIVRLVHGNENKFSFHRKKES